jgi:serine/threonine-protein kinase
MSRPEGFDPWTMVGTVVDGRWRLSRLIAETDDMAVFDAHDTKTGEPALFEIVAPTTASPTAWLQSAELIDRVSHAGLLQMIDVGATDDGMHYGAMEHVEADTLKTRLARDHRLDPGESTQIAVALASVLDAIHEAGGVHANLHPARVFVSAPDRPLEVRLSPGVRRVRVLDLDNVAAQRIRTRHTEIPWDELVRTISIPLAYCAPENLLGRFPDEQSEVYALGALLYEMLCGTPPHARPSYAALAVARLVYPPFPLPAEVPARLRYEVERALAQDPSERHPSIRSFGVALASALRTLEVASPERTSAPPSIPRVPPPRLPALLTPPPLGEWAALASEQPLELRDTARPIVLHSQPESPVRKRVRASPLAAMLAGLTGAGTVVLALSVLSALFSPTTKRSEGTLASQPTAIVTMPKRAPAARRQPAAVSSSDTAKPRSTQSATRLREQKPVAPSAEQAARAPDRPVPASGSRANATGNRTGSKQPSAPQPNGSDEQPSHAGSFRPLSP